MEDAGTQRRAAHARVALCVLIAVTKDIAVQSCTSRPIRGRNVEHRVATQMVRVTGGCHVIWVCDVRCARWLLEAYLVALVCLCGKTRSEHGAGRLL